MHLKTEEIIYLSANDNIKHIRPTSTIVDFKKQNYSKSNHNCIMNYEHKGFLVNVL